MGMALPPKAGPVEGWLTEVDLATGGAMEKVPMDDPKVTSWGNVVFAHTCGLHEVVTWSELTTSIDTATFRGWGRARGKGGDTPYRSGRCIGENLKSHNAGGGTADGRKNSNGVVANGDGRAVGSSTGCYENGAGYGDGPDGL